MIVVELVGKFYDNHSLAIVNRNIAVQMANREDIEFVITPLDSYDPAHNLSKKVVKTLKSLQGKEVEHVDVQIRHGYPPIWKWTTS